MSSLLSYKNYNGTVEYSKEDECLFGKVVGIKSLLSYEGNSIQELEKDFQTVIEEYLADCEERGVQPEQPYKETLNAAVEEAIGKMVAD
jgi:predicted HicB family RNase H-like nuclease